MIRKAAEEAEAALGPVDKGVGNSTQIGTDNIESAGSMVPVLPHLEKENFVVDGQDTRDRVEEELAVIVGAVDSDADETGEKVGTRQGQGISKNTEELSGERDRVEDKHSTLGESDSDEAMRELFDKQHESSEGIELSEIFGPGASQIVFNPSKSSTPTREDPNKRSASMGDEGDDSRKENLTGLDHLKRPKLDLSASDSDFERSLHLPASPAPDDAGGGEGFVSPQASPLKMADNGNLNTGGGHENVVSGDGGTVVNDVGGQGEHGDHGGERDFDLRLVDKGGGHEEDEPREIVAQDGGSSDGSSKSDVSKMSQQVPLSE